MLRETIKESNKGLEAERQKLSTEDESIIEELDKKETAVSQKQSGSETKNEQQPNVIVVEVNTATNDNADDGMADAKIEFQLDDEERNRRQNKSCHTSNAIKH